jgi:hypothetical protein
MDIKELKNRVIEFRDARDWAQYHNPKDLAIPRAIRKIVEESKKNSATF